MRTTTLTGRLIIPMFVLLAIGEFNVEAFDGLMDNTKLKRLAFKSEDNDSNIVIDTVNGPQKDGYLEIDKIQVTETDQGTMYMIIGQKGVKQFLEEQKFKEDFMQFLKMLAVTSSDVVTLGYTDETYEKDAFAILATKEGTNIVLDGGAVKDFQKLGDRTIMTLQNGSTAYIYDDEIVAAFERKDYEHKGSVYHLDGEKFARAFTKDGEPIAAFTKADKLYFLDRDDPSQLDGAAIDLKTTDVKNVGFFMNKDGSFVVGQTGECEFMHRRFDGSIEPIAA